MKKSILTALVFSFLLVGCLEKKQEAVTEPASEAEVGASEVGSWSTDCVAGDSDSHIVLHRFEDGALTSVRYIYQNTLVCDPANLNFVIMMYGPYAITGDHASLAASKNFTQQIQAVYIIPQNSTAAAYLNGDTFCGYNDWVATEPKFGFGCDEGTQFNASLVTYNSTHMGVFSISSNEASMQVGESCNVVGYQGLCPTEQDRAQTLDQRILYKR